MLACCPPLDDSLDPEFFRALGDSTRLMLVARLAAAGGPIPVSEAATCCGVHLSGVSRHLTQLRRAGIVVAERRGREVLVSLEGRAVAAALRQLADALEASPCCAPSPAASCCGPKTQEDPTP